jgi:hypothetical protein
LTRDQLDMPSTLRGVAYPQVSDYQSMPEHTHNDSQNDSDSESNVEELISNPYEFARESSDNDDSTLGEVDERGRPALFTPSASSTTLVDPDLADHLQRGVVLVDDLVTSAMDSFHRIRSLQG